MSSHKQRKKFRKIQQQILNKKKGCEQRPSIVLQMDLLDHMPQHTDSNQPTRCKNTGCHGRSRIYCDKCNVHLCLQKERNCFSAFHRKQ